MATQRTLAFARKLWATDTELARDRTDYTSFEDMPPQLQQWWCDRAISKIAELHLLDATGYPT